MITCSDNDGIDGCYAMCNHCHHGECNFDRLSCLIKEGFPPVDPMGCCPDFFCNAVWNREDDDPFGFDVSYKEFFGHEYNESWKDEDPPTPNMEEGIE